MMDRIRDLSYMTLGVVSVHRKKEYRKVAGSGLLGKEHGAEGDRPSQRRRDYLGDARKLLQDFDSIRGYSWGSAYLAHLYRALCHASRWNRWLRRHDYRLMPMRDFRVEIDAITSPYGINSYGGHIGAWFFLTGYMKTCPFPSSVARCCPSNRVMRQFGYNQTRPADPEDVGEDHCIVLRRNQHHDWSDLLSKWVDKWQDREQTCLRGQPINSFANHDHYME
ncbi:hypothetical protein PIB30_076255 [Stylosanthes scabra]|uniref:Uncharacterized protein n=1 Tax=Stylosanthes scabra TaxID=79078 RepID=A0ABU6TPS0_9FABA|nr:hypothetical protein [Stylosanthes scabra]